VEVGGHTPVLLGAVCQFVAPAPGEIVVDATVGLGGHAAAFAEAIGGSGVLVGLDVDAGNLDSAKSRLAGFPGRLRLTRGSFAELSAVLAEAGIERVDVIFADLGLCSRQLDDASRGFSFQQDGPLDMRMDDRLETTAADLVNRLREQELADLIYHHGQEPQSRRIARHLCTLRRSKRITRTAELATAVAKAVRVDPASRRSRIHPATRTFQALRIAVNDELGALDRLLACAPQYLRPGGRIGVISFHSLEDRRVKRDFLLRKSEGLYEVATRKPVGPEQEERKANPRSRSAKLRVAVRTGEGINDSGTGRGAAAGGSERSG